MASMAETMHDRGSFGRLHWGAVISGVLLALAVHIVLGLFGAAFGFAAEPADSKGVGAGAAIWALLTPFVASWLGAWLAVKMAGARDEANASLHGVIVWCIGLIAGAIFLTGTLASGAMTAGTAASGNAGVARLQAREQTGRTTVSGPRAEAAADQAAKGAAAGTGAAGLAALLGLAGALIGANVTARGRSGKGFGFKITREHRTERHDGGEARAGGERYATTERGYGGELGTREGTVRPPGEVIRREEVLRNEGQGLPPTDPYQQH
jgi:hypothetical protein